MCIAWKAKPDQAKPQDDSKEAKGYGNDTQCDDENQGS